MANKCKECGCTCKRCISSDHDVQLHVEIENLKQRLVEKETHIVTMETNFLNEANKFPSGELVAVREELLTWQDKYKRLYEAHRRVQRVNQGLEDKLLKLVDVCETEKGALTKDVATLSHKLADANYAIKKLTEDNERYKNDVSLAIQFLQCKQSNFVAQKFDSLSPEVQSQVANYMTHKKKPEERKTVADVKSIKVPIPTFPPTAMVYSVPKSPKPERKEEVDVETPSVDIVSAAIMAKVLEERQRERALVKHCDTCTCAKSLRIVYDNTHHSVGTQTGEYKKMLCLRCNENIQHSATAATNPPQSNQSPNSSATDMCRAYNALKIRCPTTASGPPPPGLIPNPEQTKLGIRLPLNTGPNIPNLGDNMQGVHVLTPEGSAATNVSLPLSSDPSSNAIQTQDDNQTAANLQQSVNSDTFGLASGAEAANQDLVSQLPGGLQADQVTTSPVPGAKKWHQSVTPDLRSHLVHKLVKAIFLAPDPQALLDKRMHNMVAYARKVEGDMYEIANSRSEYYQLLAQNIYKIQKELEEKRQKRKEQKLQQQHT